MTVLEVDILRKRISLSMKADPNKMAWTVYMLKCSDDSLYTGITMNLERRLEEHLKGKGAKYTKHRGPFTVVFTERHETRGQALRKEAAIKAMTRKEKLDLIQTR